MLGFGSSLLRCERAVFQPGQGHRQGLVDPLGAPVPVPQGAPFLPVDHSQASAGPGGEVSEQDEVTDLVLGQKFSYLQALVISIVHQ